MSKHKPNFKRQTIFLALTFGVGCFFICESSLLADDTVNSLQQEIIYAKEKQQTFSGKIDNAGVALEKEKSSVVQQEAERLIEELKKNGYSNIYKDTAPKQETQETPKETAPAVSVKLKTYEKKEPEKKPFWSWTHFRLIPKNREPDKSPAEVNSHLTEGQALYKVAVSDNKITLREAVEIGVANSLELQAAKQRVEVAYAKVTEAKRALFPAVQLTADVNGGHVEGAIPELNAQGSNLLPATQRFYKGENHKINISQPLYYGGELVNTLKQAQENVKVAKVEYEKLKNDLIHQIRIAYYGAVKSEYNVQYQIELFEKISQLYKQVKDAHEQKLVPEIDYLNVESQYYQVLYQVESSKNDSLSANVIFRQSMYLSENQPVPVDLKLDFVKLTPNFDELLDLSLNNSADIRLKMIELEVARYGIDITHSKKLPRFDLRGSFGYLGEAFHDSESFLEGKADNDLEKEWYLGVHGSMPLGANSVEYDQVKHVYGPTVLALTGSDDWRHHVAFNLWDKLSDITDEKAAQASLLQAESDYQKVKNEITLKLRDDFYNLQKSLIQIDSSIAKIKYQERQNSILEYTMGLQETAAPAYAEALISYAQDKFAFIQAVTDYKIAVSSLSVSIGDLDYFENKS